MHSVLWPASYPAVHDTKVHFTHVPSSPQFVSSCSRATIVWGKLWPFCCHSAAPTVSHSTLSSRSCSRTMASTSDFWSMSGSSISPQTLPHPSSGASCKTTTVWLTVSDPSKRFLSRNMILSISCSFAKFLQMQTRLLDYPNLIPRPLDIMTLGMCTIYTRSPLV